MTNATNARQEYRLEKSNGRIAPIIVNTARANSWPYIIKDGEYVEDFGEALAELDSMISAYGWDARGKVMFIDRDAPVAKWATLRDGMEIAR